MNENEIITALRCCADRGCEFCTEQGKPYCRETVASLAWDLINRKDADLKQKHTEIDILIRKNARLKDEVSELRAEVERLKSPYEQQVEVSKKLEAEIASEARKEFAERLDDLLNNEGGCDSEPGTWARGWDDAITRAIEISSTLLTELTERKEDEGK